MNLTGCLVSTPEEVEALRVIRNAGRQFMTGDTREVSPEAQRAWWERVRQLPDADFIPVVYRSADNAIVGYGILSRRDDGRLYVSLAVAEDVRGRGAGTAIYRDLGTRTAETVYALIRDDNLPSIRAAEKAGYTLLDTRPGELLLVFRAGEPR